MMAKSISRVYFTVQVIIALLMLVAPSNAVGGVTEEWIARYSTADTWSNDRAYAMVVDAQGNVYVTGNSGQSDSGTGQDYATVKYDADGNEEWVRFYNGPGNGGDTAYAIAVDAQGNVYVTGSSETLYTGHDYATVKYDADGNEEWVSFYNGPGIGGDTAHAIAVDAQGNVYVTGVSYHGRYGSPDDYDYATVKYDADGNEEWVRFYNGPSYGWDAAYAMVVDAQGNVYVTGSSDSLNTAKDYATVKYDADGSEEWVRRYNGPGNDLDYAWAIAVDAQGNVYVTGQSYGSGTAKDYATLKYDADGNEEWVRRFNEPNNGEDIARAIAVDAQGNVYVTGSSSRSFSGPNYVTVKYGADGNEEWVARYNGPINGYDHAEAIALDAQGNVYVTGNTDSENGKDYATLKYDADGNEKWVALYNGTGNSSDFARAVAVDAQGNVYVTGWSYGSGTGAYDYATIKYIQMVWYVDGDVASSGDGRTWPTAFKTIQEAIDSATTWDEIWVKEATYYLSSPINVHTAVAIYGGFAGTETMRNQRDWQSNVTIVDGQDSVYHCFEVIGGTIDGFSITGGNANGSSSDEKRGGAMYITGAPTVENCTFFGNSAELGGAICTYYHESPNITNCMFSNNNARLGGAIFNDSSEPNITKCTFSGNSAEVGGAVYNGNESGPTITGCTFDSNRAESGGGIYNAWIFESTIANCVFSNNRAEGYDGGGIYNGLEYYSELVINDCIFSNNEAEDSNGGGMHNYSSSPTITNCSFNGNIAKNGGGIVNTYYSSPIIANCTFDRNEALYDGAGMFLDFYSEPMLRNCSFSMNSAGMYGGGLFISSSTNTVINSIFWGNTASNYGPQISLHNSATLSISYSDVEGGQAGVYQEGGTVLNWESGNIDANPLFIDAAIGDFRLTLGSPCIDSGDNEAVPLGITTDIAGYDRFIDSPLINDTGNGTPPIVDIGAYEYQGDSDGDGIADSVDIQPTQYSNDFADAAGTYGTITDRGSQLLTIQDVPDPEGVRIAASPSGGLPAATVSTCGGASTSTLTAGDEEIVTCSSVEIKVIAGTVEITFLDAHGTLATTSLSVPNSLTCEIPFTFTAPATNSDDVIVLIDGHEYRISAGQVKKIIEIDIKPLSCLNIINPWRGGLARIAILSDGDFDATEDVDRASLTFGKTGDEKSLILCSTWGRDVNRNGYKDLICYFQSMKTDFQCDDTSGILKGQTKDGTLIEGTDSVRIEPCL